jgi:hypothetical protein
MSKVTLDWLVLNLDFLEDSIVFSGRPTPAPADGGDVTETKALPSIRL